MIRYGKIFFLNPAEIWISDMKCNLSYIVKIINVFDCKWILMTIDSVTGDSSFLTAIKNQGVRYIASPLGSNHFEISVVLQYTLFENVLDKAMNENPENIFVYSLLELKECNMCLQYSFEELIIKGIADVCISISLDKNAMMIYMSKFLIPIREVFKKIKALRLD